eukprot:1619484-Pyramimonas_sp.AAC.1
MKARSRQTSRSSSRVFDATHGGSAARCEFGGEGRPPERRRGGGGLWRAFASKFGVGLAMDFRGPSQRHHALGADEMAKLTAA